MTIRAATPAETARPIVHDVPMAIRDAALAYEAAMARERDLDDDPERTLGELDEACTATDWAWVRLETAILRYEPQAWYVVGGRRWTCQKISKRGLELVWRSVAQDTKGTRP